MSTIERVRGLIASRHGRFFAAKLAAGAEKYLKAYHNFGNMNMAYNGEAAALRLIVEQVEGDIIDVGANEGQWARAVRPFAGERTIHSFEPVPQTFAKLSTTLAHTPGARLVNAGLGAREGIITLNVNPAVSEMASAYPVVDWHAGAEPIQCRITTGDRYLAEQGIAAVALLKIDVEGMEADCLAGFDGAFQQGIIASVQFEHGPSHVHSGHTLKYFVDWLELRGFALYRIFPMGLKPLHYDLHRENYEMQNLFAIRRDVAAEMGL